VRLVHLFEDYRGYEVSSDRRETLYDFYVLDAMASIVKMEQHRLAFHDEKSLWDVQEAREKVIAYLRGELLKEVYKSIAWELRHIRGTWDHAFAKPADLRLVGIDPASRRSDRPRFVDPKDERLQKLVRRKHKRKEMTRSAVQQDRESFVRSALAAFQMRGWHNEYGGKAWASICRGWLRLYEAKSTSDQAVAIDHILDLQHNNGSVLNKIGVYYDTETVKGQQDRSNWASSSFWLTNFLNEKRDAAKVESLVYGCSPEVQAIARRALFTRTGTTLPDPKPDYITRLQALAKSDGAKAAAKEALRLYNKYQNDDTSYDERHDRLEQLKQIIIQDPEAAMRLGYYRARIPEIEATVKKDPWLATKYAIKILGRRWFAAEPLILSDPRSARRYGQEFGPEMAQNTRARFRAAAKAVR
jgi:hypothetical protein